MWLTLKNYKNPTGLSAKIHAQKVNEGFNLHMMDHADESVEDEKHESPLKLYRAENPTIKKAKTMKRKSEKYMIMQETFCFKGPFGKGLSIKPTGLHVAFAAGTGVLVFLDLVTRILLHNTGIHKLGEDFDEDFKFHLYISHQNLTETMGMDLCYKLMQVNDKLKLNNFYLNVRLTEGRDGIYGKKPDRWASTLLREQLKPHIGHIAKVYVCGPPELNMAMDISLKEVRDELKLEAEDVEIM